MDSWIGPPAPTFVGDWMVNAALGLMNLKLPVISGLPSHPELSNAYAVIVCSRPSLAHAGRPTWNPWLPVRPYVAFTSDRNTGVEVMSACWLSTYTATFTG